MTHDQLIEACRQWASKKHSVVVTDITTDAPETPDVLGWRSGHSLLIECKASRADFRADQKKMFRQAYPGVGGVMIVPPAMGSERYYACPSGMITPEELPDGWGLLYVNDAGRVACQVKSGKHDVNHDWEKSVLLSVIRRIGQAPINGCSIRAYTIESKNRATLTLSDEAA